MKKLFVMVCVVFIIGCLFDVGVLVGEGIVRGYLLNLKLIVLDVWYDLDGIWLDVDFNGIWVFGFVFKIYMVRIMIFFGEWLFS